MGAILVTGGAGYIGSHTSKLLLQKGYDVVILDTLELGHREVLNFLPGAKFVQGEIGDGNLVANLIKEHDIDAAITLPPMRPCRKASPSPSSITKTTLCRR